MEWQVECENCGQFVQVQKSDPAVCPKCESPNIDTTPLNGVPDDLQFLLPDGVEQMEMMRRRGQL